MTPRQINVLAEQHIRAHRTDGKSSSSSSETGTNADLVMFARTPAR